MLKNVEQLFQELLLSAPKRLNGIECKVLIDPHFTLETLVYCYHILGGDKVPELLTEPFKSDQTFLEHVDGAVYS